MSAADVLAGRVTWAVEQGDVIERLALLPDSSVNCVVTSPPYWGLRDYGAVGQIGLEPTPADYVAKMVEVFAEVRRVLRADGVCWVNLGDGYANDGKWGGSSGGKHVEALHGATGIGRGKRATGLKPKDLIGIPWRCAFALQADGWWLRSDVIWAKPNPMPESVADRPTRSHEYLFLLTKSARYWYDADAIREPHTDPKVVDGKFTGSGGVNRLDYAPATQGWATGGQGVVMKDREYNPAGRNRRTVWTIPTESFPSAHFATFPTALVEPCILAGCAVGGVVLDPFSGAGTTLMVALRHGRRAIGIELSPAYVSLARDRIIADQGIEPERAHEARRDAQLRLFAGESAS